MAEIEKPRRYGDLPAFAAQRFGAREGLVFEDRCHSFDDIARETDIAAKALMAAGVAAGDHVAVWLNNSDEWIFIFHGIAKIGAVLVPINTRFRTDDLAYVLGQSKSAFLITHVRSGPIEYLDMTRRVVALPSDGDDISDANFPKLRKVIVLGEDEGPGVLSWRAAKATGAGIDDDALAARAGAVDPATTALIFYTSGTTGFPKGAMHRHNLIHNVEDRIRRMAITEDDVILNYLPLFHAFGFSEGALLSILSGARHIVTETFDPNASVDLIEAERVSVIHGFEAHIKTVSEAQEARPRDVSSLRTGIFAAGPLSAVPILRRAAVTLAPIKPLTGFGMTEIWIGAGLSALDDDDERRYESSGAPGQDYEVRIVDPETGAPCGVGVEGELQVRGRYLMQGYFEKPAETAAAFAEDGWFRTGDAGYWRPDGYFRFVGRYKDMLKVGGENVDPMEVEGFLLEHAAVHQCAVIGAPDARLAEIPVAYVQRAPGGDIDEAAVIAYCRDRVASFKIPRHVVFVDDFPMTASGKIRKVELRADAAERFPGS